MPNAEWRLIFGLARWGGLRCPSEVVALKWSDVDWERSRFTVHSPKTARHIGHEQRTVPMFPELRPLFQDAFDNAEPGAIYCVNRYKDGKEVNLRTMFDRYLERSKIPVWDKPFQNCRSTRESELFKLTGGNIKAVTSWMGNSPEIALKHYAQLQEADLRQAAEQSIVGTAEEKVSGPEQTGLVRNLVRLGAELSSNVPQEKKETVDINPCDDGNLRKLSETCGTSNKRGEMGRGGFEPP